MGPPVRQDIRSRGASVESFYPTGFEFERLHEFLGEVPLIRKRSGLGSIREQISWQKRYVPTKCTGCI